jgi:hypothetical protein
VVRTSVSQEVGVAQYNDIVSVGWLGMLSRPKQEVFLHHEVCKKSDSYLMIRKGKEL